MSIDTNIKNAEELIEKGYRYAAEDYIKKIQKEYAILDIHTREKIREKYKRFIETYIKCA